jgi:hypothetical protein
VCVYSVCAVLWAGSILRRADPPSKESYRPCKRDQETEKAVKVQQRAVQP